MAPSAASTTASAPAQSPAAAGTAQPAPRKAPETATAAAGTPTKASSSANAPPAAGESQGRTPPSPDKTGADDSVGLLSSQAKASSQSNNIYGGTFHSANFNVGPAAERRQTWAERLHVVERSDYASEPGDADPLFDQACAVWSQSRIIVLRHQQGGQRRAESLLRRICYWASGCEPSRKLLSDTNDLALPLHELAPPEGWPHDFHGSLVMLQRRQEPMTTRFLSSNNGVGVKTLHQRLAGTDTRLLIALAAEWDAGEGALDPFDKLVRTLEIDAPGQRERPEPARAGEPFDAAPRIAAGLFEGLRIEEFRALVDDLASGMAPVEAPPAPAAADKGPAPPVPRAPATPPTLPTRHQRWKAGDLDGVLGELGIRYVISPADFGAGSGNVRSPGYYLADDRSPYLEANWVIAHHPALLSARADSMLERYLGAQASDRYREAFLTSLARLDGAGIREVSAGWLLKIWERSVPGQMDIDRAAQNLHILVSYLQSGSASSDAKLARSVIDALAASTAAHELKFQQDIGAEPLRRWAEAAAAEAEAPAPIQLWGQLVSDADTSAATQRLAEAQSAALWAMLRLSLDWPADVARGMTDVLQQVADDSSPWRVAAGQWDLIDQVPRSAAVVMSHLLSLSLDSEPALWLALAAGVVKAYEAPVREMMAAGAGRQRLSAATQRDAAAGQRLAFVCLNCLAPHVYADDDAPVELLRQILRHDADASGNPGLLGRLLAMAHLELEARAMFGQAGEGCLPAADIVRFLRAVALCLQGDKGVTAEQVAADLSPAVAALRAVLPQEQRRHLLHQARDSLESQFLTRDHYEAQGDRDLLAEMRRRIRATQLVLRSLSSSG